MGNTLGKGLATLASQGSMCTIRDHFTPFPDPAWCLPLWIHLLVWVKGVFPPVESASLAVLASLGTLQYCCLSEFTTL